MRLGLAYLWTLNLQRAGAASGPGRRPSTREFSGPGRLAAVTARVALRQAGSRPWIGPPSPRRPQLAAGLGRGRRGYSRPLRASFLAKLIAAQTPLVALRALTRVFCLGFRLRRWPMYWPCSLRAARRSAESLNRRPRREGFPELTDAAWSRGASRWTARAMEEGDVRIARTSRPTEVPPGFLHAVGGGMFRPGGTRNGQLRRSTDRSSR